jgi:predicted acyl esterase
LTGTAATGEEVLLRSGVAPEEGGHPGVDHRRLTEAGMVIERDVAVELRDGATIYLDLYRPAGTAEPLPALVAWGPYGKHTGTSRYDRYPNRAGVKDEWLSPYAIFEGPDPAYWCANGYAVIVADSRGSWCSEGDLHIGGQVEGESAYDVIEWAAAQEWSSGKVGMTGVSYLAIIQWLSASLRPPHLVAINPWEGWTDTYREAFAHGGMRETGWSPRWNHGLFSKGRVEDVAGMLELHPLIGSYWEEKVPAVERIDVPTYVVASWTDQGLHTRGTLEAFKRLGSAQKWLDVHGRKKWEHYHRPDNVDYVRQFFDRFLRGADNGWERRPAVRLEVRDRREPGAIREGEAWPLPQTRYEPLHLDAADGLLRSSPPDGEAEVRYDPDGRATFEIDFERDTEVVGHMKLRLWVEAERGGDLDLFVAVEKYDSAREFVGFPFSSAWDDGPVALGWLRASHRELDREKSTPEQPWHLHRQELPLPAGEAAPVEIEIWPSGTLFRAGERLRLVVSGTDIHAPLHKHEDSRNEGAHVLRTGGRYDSHLLVPVVPRRCAPGSSPCSPSSP